MAPIAAFTRHSSNVATGTAGACRRACASGLVSERSHALQTSSASSRATASGAHVGGVLEPAAAQVDGVLEVPGHPHRAAAAQRDPDPLLG